MHGLLKNDQRLELLVVLSDFTVTKGEPWMFENPANAGHPLQHAFCGDSGSPVFLINDANPGVRVIYVASAQPWDLLNPNIPEYDGIIPS